MIPLGSQVLVASDHRRRDSNAHALRLCVSDDAVRWQVLVFVASIQRRRNSHADAVRVGGKQQVQSQTACTFQQLVGLDCTASLKICAQKQNCVRILLLFSSRPIMSASSMMMSSFKTFLTRTLTPFRRGPKWTLRLSGTVRHVICLLHADTVAHICIPCIQNERHAVNLYDDSNADC